MTDLEFYNEYISEQYIYIIECQTCSGTGETECHWQDKNGVKHFNISVCTSCNGTGETK